MGFSGVAAVMKYSVDVSVREFSVAVAVAEHPVVTTDTGHLETRVDAEFPASTGRLWMCEITIY